MENRDGSINTRLITGVSPNTCQLTQHPPHLLDDCRLLLCRGLPVHGGTVSTFRRSGCLGIPPVTSCCGDERREQRRGDQTQHQDDGVNIKITKTSKAVIWRGRKYSFFCLFGGFGPEPHTYTASSIGLFPATSQTFFSALPAGRCRQYADRYQHVPHGSRGRSRCDSGIAKETIRVSRYRRYGELRETRDRSCLTRQGLLLYYYTSLIRGNQSVKGVKPRSSSTFFAESTFQVLQLHSYYNARSDDCLACAKRRPEGSCNEGNALELPVQ